MPNFMNNSPIQDAKAISFEQQLDLERFADLKEEDSDHDDGKSIIFTLVLFLTYLTLSLPLSGEENGSYKQVPFDYGNQSTQTEASTSNNDFKVPPNLNPPVGLNLVSFSLFSPFLNFNFYVLT